MDVSKTSDHINIKVKMPTPSQKLPPFSKAPNQDLKDMVFFCTLKIKMGLPKTIHHIQIKIKKPHLIQEPPAASILYSPKSGLKGNGCSYTFKMKIEINNKEHGCVKDQ